MCVTNAEFIYLKLVVACGKESALCFEAKADDSSLCSTWISKPLRSSTVGPSDNWQHW